MARSNKPRAIGYGFHILKAEVIKKAEII